MFLDEARLTARCIFLSMLRSAGFWDRPLLYIVHSETKKKQFSPNLRGFESFKKQTFTRLFTKANPRSSVLSWADSRLF